MLNGNHGPGGTVATQLKDLRMATAMAADLGLSLPLLAGAEDMFARAADGPDRSLDHSAVHRALRAMQSIGDAICKGNDDEDQRQRVEDVPGAERKRVV